MPQYKLSLKLFLLVVVINVNASAQQKNHLLSGKLIGEASRPLAFATISLLSADSVLIAKVTSDSLGSFQVTHQM